MKRNIVLTFALAALSLQAQKRIEGSYIEVVPREFSATEAPLLHITDQDVVSLYDDEIRKVGEVALKPQQFDYTIDFSIQGREVRAVKAEVLRSSVDRTFDANYTFDDYLADERLKGGSDFVLVTREMADGRTQLFGYYEWMGTSNFFAYDHFGFEYPRMYYVYDPADKTLMTMLVQYAVEYTEWVTLGAESQPQTVDLRPLALRYRNIDDDACHDGEEFVVSQTLFNADDRYEYLLPKYSLSETSDVVQDGLIDFGGGSGGSGTRAESEIHDSSEDIVLSRSSCLTAARYPVCTGFSIVAQDGTVIDDIALGDDLTLASSEDLKVIRMGGKTYLVAECLDHSAGAGRVCIAFYRVDAKASRVERVNMAMGAMRLVQKSRALSITLGNVGQGSEILVTDAAGRTVARTTVAAGQTQATVNVATTDGVYTVTRMQGGAPIESRKVILKQ